MSSGRFVAEIPIRWSATDERTALARLRTAQGLANEVLAEYLRRAAAYHRDPDLRRLRAELREAKREGRARGRLAKGAPGAVPEAVVPRVFSFDDAPDRAAAWRVLQERHGLIGLRPKSSYTEAGRAWCDRSQLFVKSLTARQLSLRHNGLDAATIHHEIAAVQRDRVLAWLGITKREGGPTGRPRFASRRDPVTSCTGSSSKKNAGGLQVDLNAGTFTWKSLRGSHPIAARVRLPKDDPWLQKALTLPIAQVRVLHRMVGRARRWYVQLVLVGTPPLAPKHRAAVAGRSPGTVGVDMGSRHIAAVGPESALLADLAPTMIARERARDVRVDDVRAGDLRKRDRWYRRLQRRISIAKARNPRNANTIRTREKVLQRTSDGKAVGRTVAVAAGFRRGSKVVVSDRVRDLTLLLADVARADAAARSNDHGRLANVILTMGDRLALEGVGYVGWQRSFGRQVRRYAPGAFEARLRRRAPLFGAGVDTIPTSLRLSQLCHGCGTFTPEPIKGPIVDRAKPACACGRAAAHRDLYSAFLARFACGGSSVDLQAATAAWTGAFRLLCGARQMYDTAEKGRLVRPFRAADDLSSPHRAAVPQARVVGSPAIVDTARATPASVRDAHEDDRGAASGRRAAMAALDRSTASRRARLRLDSVREGADGVRAGPRLETRSSTADIAGSEPCAVLAANAVATW